MEDKEIFNLREGIVSPKFIASGDIHLGHKLYNIPDLEEDLKDNFVRLCDLAVSKQVEYLVILGDLFDDNLPKQTTVAFVQGQVSRLWEKHKIQVLGIAGDHDKPLMGKSWCQICGISPAFNCRNFMGVDYYDYSNGGTAQVMKGLGQYSEYWPNVEDVQWIFLHAQFPQLYQFTENKKKVDFGEVELFTAFPNLQGVLAGDIHTPLEGRLTEKDKEAYIGYSGSLGIIDISETKHNKTVFYCDGTKLHRIPFVQRRSYVRIDYKGDSYKTFDVSNFLKLYKDSQFQPVFSVDYDSDSEPHLALLKPLYQTGFVRLSQTSRDVKTGKEEVINIRSEIKTDEKIETALTECCEGDQEIYGLLSETLTAADPKGSLDLFKAKAFT